MPIFDNFTSSLRQAIVDFEIDIDELLTTGPEDSMFDVKLQCPLQGFNFGLTEQMRNQMVPIGNTAYRRSLTGDVVAVELKPKEHGIGILINNRELKDSFEAWLSENPGLDKLDLSKQQLFKMYVTQQVTGAIKADMPTKKWYSSEGNPHLILGKLDGVWTNIFKADSTGTRKIATVLPEDPSTLTADQMIAIMREIWGKMSNEQKKLKNNRIYMNGTLFDKYMSAVEDKEMGGGGMTKRMIDGTEGLAFRGIPIVPVYSWDTDVFTYDPAETGKARYQQRILCIADGQIAMGLNFGEGDVENLSYYYDPKDQDNCIDSSVYIDIKIKRIKHLVYALSEKNQAFVLPAAPAIYEPNYEYQFGQTMYSGLSLSETVGSALSTIPVTAGTKVYARGNNFTGAVVSVLVGGVAATGVVVTNDNLLEFIVPAGAGVKTVTINNGEGATTVAQTLTVS